MEETREKLENNSEKLAKPLRNEKGQLLPNQPSLNPEGKPKGSKNFETDFLEAVGKIAKANNITRVEAMEILLRKAYSEAKNGQYNFYKDIMDRLYGKVADKTDITTAGQPIIFQIAEEIAKKRDITSESKNNS
jgi:hypothetical protein